MLFRVIKQSLPCFAMLINLVNMWHFPLLFHTLLLILLLILFIRICRLPHFRVVVVLSIMSFLDHFSYYMWVCPLRSKSDTFAKFLQFQSFVNTQFNKEIKAFQCDHGGDFDNTTFNKLFTNHEIHICFSCPCTS